MKHTIIKKIAVTALAVSVIGSFVALYVSVIRSTPQKTIAEFEQSVNALDSEGMISCFEPSIQSTYHGFFSVINGITQQDATNIAEDFLKSLSISIEPEQLSHLDLSIKKVEYSNYDTAKVTVLMRLAESNGTTQENTENISMKKIDGTWYLKE